MDLTYLGKYQGDKRDEEQATVGLPVLQWFNRSDFHEGNLIFEGGFGIERKDNFIPPPIGEIETIQHNNNKSSQQATAKTVRMAFIGYTPQYSRWFVDGKNTDKGRMELVVPKFGYDKMHEKLGGDTESGISAFVVLEKDPSRIAFELSLKTYAVADIERIIQQTKWRIQLLTKHLRENYDFPTNQTLPLYSQWVDVGTGPTTKEGGKDKGNCTHPEIVWPGVSLTTKELWSKFAVKGKATVCNSLAQWTFVSKQLNPEDLMSAVPSEEDMDRFEAMRVELDSRMENGWKKIWKIEELPTMESKQLGSGGDTVSALCKTKDFISNFFTYAKGTYSLDSKTVLVALGVSSLDKCTLTIPDANEVLAKYEASLG